MRITPCRTLISDRFPVASFVVSVPPERCFEVVCTTDPALLEPSQRGRRNRDNFFTTREQGLLRAAAGQATLLLPGEQLSRFAGASRLYYALGTYGSPWGQDPKLSVTPGPGGVPHIKLSRDFTGKSLKRRWGSPAQSARYGSQRQPVLTWGGDAVLQAPATASTARNAQGVSHGSQYDDGFDPSLWQRSADSKPGGSTHGERARGEPAHAGSARVRQTHPGAAQSQADAVGPRRSIANARARGLESSRGQPSHGYPLASADGGRQHQRTFGTGSSCALTSSSASQGAGSTGAVPFRTVVAEPPGFEDGAAALKARQREPHQRFGKRPSYGERNGWFETEFGSRRTAAAGVGHDTADRGPAHRGGQDHGARTHEARPSQVRGKQAHPAVTRGADTGFEDGVAVRRAHRFGGTVAAQSPRVSPPSPQLEKWRRFYGQGGAAAPTLDEAPQAPWPQQTPVLPDDVLLDGAPSQHLPPPSVSPSPPSNQASPPLAPPVPTGLPLTIPEKFRIVSQVAALVSGQELYSALRLNTDGQGLSWGMVLFSQRSGDLGRVLAACHRRDPAAFAATFGPNAATLLELTASDSEEVRMQPVGGLELWRNAAQPGEIPWPERFRNAGHLPPFRAAQHEVAIEGYLDPNLEFARGLGLTTDRALAMLYDRCIDMGSLAAREWVASAIGPLNAPELQRAALDAVGAADVMAFQQSHEGLVVSGEWDATTHAALLDVLRRSGNPMALSLGTAAAMAESLVAAAEAEQRSWAFRLRAIFENRTGLQDTTFDLNLP